MTTAEKFTFIFNSGHSFTFQNSVGRFDGEWENLLIWTHVQLPLNQPIKQSKRKLFKDIDDLLDDCIKYIKTIK